MDVLLNIESLTVQFPKHRRLLTAVDNIELKMTKGETLALVGESGCGKTVTALSVIRLVPLPGSIVEGKIEFKNKNILTLSEKQMSMIRGKEIGIILQDPLSALNPVMVVGNQIAEVLRTHFSYNRKEARNRTIELMEKVQLPNGSDIYNTYPHQLSGGQRQRVLIALALSCNPALLIADEPTTALDVSIQSQILSLLQELKNEFHLSLLLITHDLSIVAEMADRVAVMYAGKIVEQARVHDLFTKPKHPYTKALLQAIPQIDFSRHKKVSKIMPMKGSVPDLTNLPNGCSFHPRCPISDEICQLSFPNKTFSNEGSYVTCFKAS